MFLLLFSYLANAQQYILDQAFKKRAQTGQYTFTHLQENTFPVHKADRDILIDQTIRLSKKINRDSRMESFYGTIEAGFSTLTFHKEVIADEVFYSILLSTRVNNMCILFDLVKKSRSKRETQCLLIDFTTYLAALP